MSKLKFLSEFAQKLSLNSINCRVYNILTKRCICVSFSNQKGNEAKKDTNPVPEEKKEICPKYDLVPVTPKSDICLMHSEPSPLDVEVCYPELPSSERVPVEAGRPPTPLDAKVVIIGAGMAGLSAAHRLIQAGIRNLLILEAGTRPGGRIRSLWIKDVVVEMGSERRLSQDYNNPLLEVAMCDNLLPRPMSQTDPSKGLFRESDGRELPLPVTYKAYIAMKRIMQTYETLISTAGPRTKGSLLNYIGVRSQQELRRLPAGQVNTVSARAMVGLVNAIRGKDGNEKDFISNDALGTYAQIPGAKIQIPLGFVGELGPLLKSIGAERIKYKKLVQTVRWGTVYASDVPRALVKCSDGTEFPAHYVLVTCPLGVLKANAETMFCPSLPAKKIEAIRSMEYQHMNKAFFEYDRPLWAWRHEPINVSWEQAAMCSRSGWLGGLVKLEEMRGSHYILTATIKGKEASVNLEQSNLLKVKEEVTDFLQEYLGDNDIPEPSGVWKSSWSGDKNFLGAYSYLDSDTGGENLALQNELSAPLPLTGDTYPPIIYFAGEATCPGHNGTVHGARLSGIREAERLIKIVKKLPKKEDDFCDQQAAIIGVAVC